MNSSLKATLRAALVFVWAIACSGHAASAPLSIDELTAQAANAYRYSGPAGVLRMEKSCWARTAKAPARQALTECGRVLLTGGVIDLAMQRQEMRGAMPDFAPQVQRARFMANARRLGLNAEQAQQVLADLMNEDLLDIVAGLAQSGL